MYPSLPFLLPERSLGRVGSSLSTFLFFFVDITVQKKSFVIFYPFFVTRLTRRGSFPRLKLLENRSLAGSLGLFGLMPAVLVAARRFLTAGLCRAGLAGGVG